jgi:hypothetical protein
MSRIIVRRIVFCENAGQKNRADRVFSNGRRKKEKTPEKSSAGPDFLGFAQKIDIILKKHMFFDKKYILFSLF